MSQGGKAQPVYVVSDDELVENGGTFSVEGGPAVRVTGLTSATLETTARGVTGGDSRPVYVVNDKSILSRGVQGGSGVVVTDAAQAVRGVTGLVATPVWVTNGDEWPGGGGSSPVTTETPLFRAISNATTGFANNLTVDKPTGTVDGDLMLLMVSLATLQTINTPAGWTPIETVDIGASGSDNRLAVFSRVAASEPANYNVTLGSFSNITLGIISWYSNTAQPLIVDVSATNVNTPATTSHVAPSVTTTISNTALNCFYTLTNSNVGSPDTGMTERWDYPSGGSESYLMTGDVAAIGATGTRTMTGNNLTSASITVAVAEDVS